MSLARISRSVCTVYLEPNPQSEASSELLFGESVQILEHDGEWCQIKSVHDGYAGYVKTAACDLNEAPSSTHWVGTKATLLFENPDIKAPVIQHILFGSELAAVETSTPENFLELRGEGFIWAAHCLEKKELLSSSMVEIAQQHYLNAPYRWGGRSTEGCDCSGLVQMLAKSKGINLPRDSGDQERALNANIDFENRAAEDLVYWPGHVGILKSPDLLLHSTAHTLRCCIEPLQEVIDRAGNPSSIKRAIFE